MTSRASGSSPPVTLPGRAANADDVAISSAGVVSVEADAASARSRSFSVPRPQPASGLGGNLFLPTPRAAGARQMPTQGIRQGFLEASNVDLASAMVNVIDAQRSFQMDTKAIQTQDQLMQIANEIRR